MNAPIPKPVRPRPWHREPWPWFIIGLLGSAVIASFITLWIALSNPDVQVVDEARYDEIRSELRAQPAAEDLESGDVDPPGDDA